VTRNFQCCGARCRHCDEWRDINTQPVEPPTAWCLDCKATTYSDAQGKCRACSPTK